MARKSRGKRRARRLKSKFNSTKKMKKAFAFKSVATALETIYEDEVLGDEIFPCLIFNGSLGRRPSHSSKKSNEKAVFKKHEDAGAGDVSVSLQEIGNKKMNFDKIVPAALDTASLETKQIVSNSLHDALCVQNRCVNGCRAWKLLRALDYAWPGMLKIFLREDREFFCEVVDYLICGSARP